MRTFFRRRKHQRVIGWRSLNRKLSVGIRRYGIESLEPRHMLAATSFDGDTKGDIVGFVDNQIWVSSSTGTKLNSTIWGVWSNQTVWDYQSVGDFNGDGKKDIVGRSSSGNYYVGLSSGSSFTTSLWGSLDSTLTYRDSLIGDFNNDSRDDIASRDENGRWWVAYSNGQSFSKTAAALWSNQVAWLDTQVGDLNGDGFDDIVSRADVGSWWVALGSANGQFQTALWGAWSPDLFWFDVHVGDVNGDGRDDIVGRTYYGHWWVAKSNGFGSTNEFWTSWSSAVQWLDVQLVDLQGNGRASLVGRTDSGAWWAGVSNGATFVNQYWTAWDGTRTWRDVMPTDFNGDGRVDLIGRTSGSWWVAMSNGTSFRNMYAGAWAPVPWVRVQGSQEQPNLLIERAPTAPNLTNGSVSHMVNKLLADRLENQIGYLEYLQQNSGGSMNFATQLVDLQRTRANLLSFNSSIETIMSNPSSTVVLGPELILNRQTLALADRIALGHMSDTLKGSSRGFDSIEDVRKMAIEWYSGLIDETLKESRTHVDRLSNLLSVAAGPLAFLVQGVVGATFTGISAALESGKVLAADRNATVQDYRQTIDAYFNWTQSAGQQLNESIDEWADTGRTETTSAPYLTDIYQGLAKDVASQFNYNNNQTIADQLADNFPKVQQLTEQYNARKAQNYWWVGSWSFVANKGLSTQTQITFELNADRTGTIQCSGYYRGSGQFMAGENRILDDEGFSKIAIGNFESSLEGETPEKFTEVSLFFVLAELQTPSGTLDGLPFSANDK